MTDKKGVPEELMDEAFGALPMVPPSAKVGFVKAVGYLFGGMANYVAAWSRRPTQAIDDKTEAKSSVVRAVAEAAAKRAASDSEIVEAAMLAYLPKELRRQQNKAKVVEHAAETLSEQENLAPPKRDVEDDWLNAFERFCEDASSEKMQQLWGRVLAGEVSAPGSFSKTTIRFLSELERDVATAFEEISADIVLNMVFLLEDDQKNARLTQLLELEAAGLIASVSGFLSWTPHVREDGIFSLHGSNFGLVGRVANKESFSIEVLPVTAVGRQILSILPDHDESKKLIEISTFLRNRKQDVLNKASISGISLCRVVEEDGRPPRLKNIELLWGSDPFSKAA